MNRLLFALLTLSLIACSQPTATPSTALPTVTPAPITTILSGPTPQNSSPLCGRVEMRGNDFVNVQAARDAESCFWQAYQQCVAGKMLNVHNMTDINTSVASRFVLQSTNGQCTINVTSGADIILSTDASGAPGARGGALLLSTDCTQMTVDETLGVLHLSGCRGQQTGVDIPVPG